MRRSFAGGVASIPTGTYVGTTGDESVAGTKTWTGRQIIGHSLQFGSATSAMQIVNASGTKGPRLSMQSKDTATGTNSAELQLIPDANCDPAAGIASEILWFNKTGLNYERFLIAWVNNTLVIAQNTNGLGVNRNMYIQAGGQTGPGVPNQNAITIRGDASVEVLASTYVLATPFVPGATTVSSVVDGVSAVLSQPVITTAEWPAGSQASGWVTVSGRTIAVTFTAGSATVTGAFLTADVGAAVASVRTFGGTSGLNLVDPGNSGKTFLTLDTMTGGGTSALTDQARIQFRRGGSDRWRFGLNAGGGNSDALEMFLVNIGPVSRYEYSELVSSVAFESGSAVATGNFTAAMVGKSIMAVTSGFLGNTVTVSSVVPGVSATLSTTSALTGSSNVIVGNSNFYLNNNTDRTRFIIDSRAGGSGRADTSIEFRRGGSNKWSVGNNASGGLLDSLDFVSTGGFLPLRLGLTGAAQIGFLGTAPIAKRTATADATDLATVITLANALKADLVAYGLKVA